MKLEKQYLNKVLKDLDEKKLMSFAKKIVNIYRKFPEYSYWSNSVKEGKDKCEFCGREFEEKIIEPEAHHDPTLTDIVYEVMLDLLEKEEDFDTFDIIRIVNDMHYNNAISYYIVCSCCHEITHKRNKVNR